MEIRINHRVRAGLLALAIAGGTTLAVAGPASAWTWSSTVTVKGTACGGYSNGAQTATVKGVLNQQYAYSPESGLGQPPSYSLTWTNVPSGGGYAWVWVHCSVSPDYGVWVHVVRPGYGSTEYVNI